MMADRGLYGERLSSKFGVQEPPTIVTMKPNHSNVAATRIRSSTWASVFSDPLPVEDAYLIQLNLRACPDHEYWLDGRSLGKRTFGAGETAIHDLKRDPRALIHTPMDSLMVYLPRDVLNEICDDAGAPRIDELSRTPGHSRDDPVVRSIGGLLVGALDRQADAPQIYLDHLVMAMTAHVVTVYGDMRVPRPASARGLSPWQERRAKEVLAARLDGNIALAAVAQECGLSVGHFARLFRASVGEPPHRWLMRQRIELAKSLIRRGGLSLADTALAAGFADQSHLTRSFALVVGATPGAWRRNLRAARSPADG